jgi:hypothetical protein
MIMKAAAIVQAVPVLKLRITARNMAAVTAQRSRVT